MVDQFVALQWLHTMLESVRAYEKEIASLIDQEDKLITLDQISNLYGYAECIASEQRQCERELKGK